MGTGPEQAYAEPLQRTRGPAELAAEHGRNPAVSNPDMDTDRWVGREGSRRGGDACQCLGLAALTGLLCRQYVAGAACPYLAASATAAQMFRCYQFSTTAIVAIRD